MSVHREGALAEILACWSAQPAGLLVAALQDNLLETVQRIRTITAVPLILIINQLDEDRQVALLEAGADLLVQRPYSNRLLLAQARNLAQRNQSASAFQLSAVQSGEIQIDPLARTIHLGHGKPIRLTPREFEIFHLLYTHQGQVLTVDQMIEQIWGWGNPAENGSLRTLISRLRTKLGIGPDSLLQIDSVAGIGYCLTLNIFLPSPART